MYNHYISHQPITPFSHQHKSTSPKMSTASSSLLHDFHPRKLLSEPTNPAPAPSLSHPSATTNFNGNVLMLLSVLVCGVVCSLFLHYIIRCALRCSSSITFTEPGINTTSTRVANTAGIKQKALKTFPVVTYPPEMNLPGLDTECVICLSEYVAGDKLRLLPKCNHGFHVRCIDKWLKSHSSCPKCRHCLIETCEKIVGCEQSSSPPESTQETVVRIVTVEQERLGSGNTEN